MFKYGVFMDRDGTVSKEVGYVNHLSRFELLPRSAAAIKKLNDNNIAAVLATNQAGVARGYFREEMILKVHEKLQHLLAQEGAHLDKIYYCPHHPRVGPEGYRIKCSCRKPATGMLEQGARELGLDLVNCYMVGDKISDVETGKRAGCKTVMVMTGYGIGEYENDRETWTVYPDYIAEDLFEAVLWIISDIEKRTGEK